MYVFAVMIDFKISLIDLGFFVLLTATTKLSNRGFIFISIVFGES